MLVFRLLLTRYINRKRQNPILQLPFGIQERVCLISNELANNLNLHPIDKIKVQHAAGTSYENVYLAIVHVTKKYYVEIELTEFKSTDNFEIIIGMDVISKGDFAITNQNGITTFSFRLPSSTTIDFTKP